MTIEKRVTQNSIVIGWCFWEKFWHGSIDPQNFVVVFVFVFVFVILIFLKVAKTFDMAGVMHTRS